MSVDEDALREMAANRGCRLVKSRVRTEGRGDYGKFGLKDAKSGREVFGFGKRGLTAAPDEIEQFLRGGAAATWKTSLGATPVKRRAKTPKPPPPKPEPKLVIREAKPKDAEALAKLIVELGYEVTAADVRKRMGALARMERPTLVAERGEVIGCLTWFVTYVLHRPKPVGRITMMVVGEATRGEGVGAALLDAALERMRREECGLAEVTSNMKRIRAHRFYEKLGFERTSYRFGKVLD